MPAKSKKQQRFMGMVHAYQKGELKDAPESVKKAAGSMTKKAAKDFAETKHKGLPEKKAKKVKEDVDVAEDFKSMTFKEYVELDEGAWDFIKGAGREVGSKIAKKISDYGQSGFGGTMADIWQAGKEASAAGKAERALKTQLAQLAKLAQTAGGQAALKAALTRAAPTAKQIAPAPTPAAKQAAPAPGGRAAAFQTTAKPKMKMGQFGPEYQMAGLETPVLGKYLTDGVLDFVGGAGKAIGQKVAQSAPVRAGREIVQAGRQASAAADANKFAAMAQSLISTIRNTPNGAALVKQMLEQMGDLGKVLARYLQQLANVKPAAPAGA